MRCCLMLEGISAGALRCPQHQHYTRACHIQISSYQTPLEGASRTGSTALAEVAGDNEHEPDASPCQRAGAAGCGRHDEKPELEEESYRVHGHAGCIRNSMRGVINRLGVCNRKRLEEGRVEGARRWMLVV
jgi:hypothetical protein